MATEKRMMFVDVFKKNLCHYCNTYMSDEPCEPGECWVRDVIAQTDTVDAVEVVRCAFCKACVNIDGLSKAIIWCNRQRMAVSPHDFCSHGERKNDG